MRYFILLAALFIFGCGTELTPEEKQKRQERIEATQKRREKYVPVKSIVGKTVTSVKPARNGYIINFDDGSMISLTCYKYSIRENRY